MKPEAYFNFIGFQTMVVLFFVAAAIMWLKPALWLHSFTLFSGALTGWLAAKTDEVLVIAFLIFAFAFFAGFASTRHTWMFAILLALWTPAFTSIAYVTGATRFPLTTPGILMPLIFAFAGVYSGLAIKKVSKGAGRMLLPQS